MKRHIKDGFDGFWDEIKPDNFSNTQYIEVRKAFYGGALFLFAELLQALDNESEEKCYQFLDEIKNEFEEFTKQLKEKNIKWNIT